MENRFFQYSIFRLFNIPFVKGTSSFDILNSIILNIEKLVEYINVFLPIVKELSKGRSLNDLIY